MGLQEELLQIVQSLNSEQLAQLLVYAKHLKTSASGQGLSPELERILEEDAELLQWLAQ